MTHYLMRLALSPSRLALNPMIIQHSPSGHVPVYLTIESFSNLATVWISHSIIPFHPAVLFQLLLYSCIKVQRPLYSHKTHLCLELLECYSCKWLSHSISYHISCWNVVHFQVSFLSEVSDEVVADVNMLGPVIKVGILWVSWGHVHGALLGHSWTGLTCQWWKQCQVL